MSSHLADLPLLSRLLEQALELDPERIEAWVAGLPPEHERLQPALRRMLALRRSRSHAAFMAMGPCLEDADDSVARPGDIVGTYRLIREIGRGGMGAVWLAERADGTLKRQVALKLPRLAWGARLAERMAHERDIGALLEHPNIARLYDAGVDDRGRPYLALEHVDGRPVDAWCQERSLGVPERLRLFLQIVRAVAYAHGRLVVHRDLKPSNVLVTPDGCAHLLDFGIARLLQEEASGEARPTQEQDRVLTPHYASPEQLRGETVTVASDVYSLGVLLFELLTGRLPHEPVRRNLAALELAVLDHDAPPASSRADEPQTARALRGELDAILAKALKRRPEERYATADALAEDIERHLGGERVLAQPDSLRYRLGKALRRHRVGFAAAGAVLLAVLGGTTVALVQARRATDAADRARVVKEFVIDVFKVNQHSQAANAELRQLPVELLLERGAKLIDSRYPGQTPLQAELHGVVGGIFAGMGANERAAVEAMRQLETQAGAGASAAERAQATLLLAQALLAQGRPAEAQAMARNALAWAEGDPLLRPRTLALLAHALLQQGRHEEGLRALDEAEQGMQGQPALVADAARARSLRASLLVFAGRFDEARPLYAAAIAAALVAEGPLSPTAIDIRLAAAGNLSRQDRDYEARPHREAAYAALRASGAAGEVRAALEASDIDTTRFLMRRIGFDEARAALEQGRAMIAARGPLVPPRVAARLDFNLGRALLDAGDVQHADPLIAASVKTLRREAERVRDQALYAGTQGLVAMAAGRHDEAEALFREELDLERSAGAAGHGERVSDLARRALNRSMQGRFDEAEALLAPAAADAAAGADAAAPAGPRELARRALARVRQDRGDAAAALAVLPASDAGEGLPASFDAQQLRGEILCALGRRGDGLALLERSLQRRQAEDYAHSPHLARARGVAGLCALAAGQRQRAAELAALARASLLEQPAVSAYFKRSAEQLDGLLRTRMSGLSPPARLNE